MTRDPFRKDRSLFQTFSHQCASNNWAVVFQGYSVFNWTTEMSACLQAIIQVWQNKVLDKPRLRHITLYFGIDFEQNIVYNILGFCKFDEIVPKQD